jgi:hypothetical protein
MSENPIYLGDALYAFFDGNGIELRLNDHASGCLIYLEPEVIEALKLFWAHAKQRAQVQDGTRVQDCVDRSGPYSNPID